MATITPLPGKPFTPNGRDRPRVLMVEDNALVAIMIKNFLGQIGCAVVGPFTDIDVAMITAQVEPIDAAIVDHVRDGDHRYAVEDVLTLSQIPFGGVFAAPPEGSDRYRNRPFIIKPFSVEQLYTFVAELLQGGARQLAT